MRPQVLVDSGPLVAFLNRRDQYHLWSKQQFAQIEPPLLSCESVISEVCFLLRRQPKGVDTVMELLGRGLIVLPFRLSEEIIWVWKLLARYSRASMSLADACLVRMSELNSDSAVLTLDSDFEKIYRRNRRQIIPTIMPSRE